VPGVGHSWPSEKLSVQFAELGKPRFRVMWLLIIAASLALLAFTLESMIRDDSEIRKSVLEIVRYVIATALGWAIGRETRV
jgi:hypothetical protein